MRTLKNCMLVKIILAGTLFCLCCDNDSEPHLYTRDWTLYLGAELNRRFSEIDGGIEGIVLPNGNALIAIQPRLPILIEIDPAAGTIVATTGMPGWVIDLHQTLDGKVMVANTRTGFSYYDIGYYKTSTHSVELISAPPNSINDPPEIKYIYLGDSFLYTHNPNLLTPQLEEVYLAKWDLDGLLIWKKIIDPTMENKIARIAAVNSDHLIISSVADYNASRRWKVGKVSADGEMLWQSDVPSNYNDWAQSVCENALGEVLVVNQDKATKFDANGNELWSTTIRGSDDDVIFSNALATADGGLIVQRKNGRSRLLKLDGTGKIIWDDLYWETDGYGQLSFLELPNGDLLSVSFSGFVTKYRKK